MTRNGLSAMAREQRSRIVDVVAILSDFSFPFSFSCSPLFLFSPKSSLIFVVDTHNLGSISIQRKGTKKERIAEVNQPQIFF